MKRFLIIFLFLLGIQSIAYCKSSPASIELGIKLDRAEYFAVDRDLSIKLTIKNVGRKEIAASNIMRILKTGEILVNENKYSLRNQFMYFLKVYPHDLKPNQEGEYYLDLRKVAKIDEAGAYTIQWKYLNLESKQIKQEIKSFEEGTYKTYYPDGTIKSEETIKNGKRNGLCKNYDISTLQSGASWSEVNYVDDKRQGTGKGYYGSGALYYEMEFKDDKVLGSKFYYETGKLHMERLLKDGKEIHVITYDENGKILADYNPNKSGFLFNKF